VVNEKERALKQLIQTEKMASLGQMAAGLAHELNNAIAVLERNSTWLSQRVADFILQEHREDYKFFSSGLEQGRRFSSRDIRKRTKELIKKFPVDQENARKLAETGISSSELKELPGTLDEITDEIYTYWEFGASFHDMKIAAQHATHVVKSVKALASQSSAREPNVDVNQSIHEALALLSSPLRKVEVKLNLGKLPAMTANKGELVQIWANLVKNSVEAMAKAEIDDQHLMISSEARDKTMLVRIQDNGPGIPGDAVERIFQPSFTTKERGLDFGLGLGLTIVERIVLSYDGEISVRSKPGKTVFTVKLK
jgi:C4-dicarboxylate-specific signal transduction histidine kinase